MKYLLVAPQLGFAPSGKVFPGGLQQFARCVARALASSPTIEKLGVWSLLELPGTEKIIERLIRVYAHPSLDLEVRVFGGSRAGLAAAITWACFRRSYDRIMYLLVNQATLSEMPWHLPYEVWEIGRELFERVSWWKFRALRRADTLLSISQSTADIAVENNPGLPKGKVVHLCVEPPLFEREPWEDPLTAVSYDPAKRDLAVMIVANLPLGMLYKGHQQLIAAWPEVVETCPGAELWIVGDGSGRPFLEQMIKLLPPAVARQILFLGSISEAERDERYRRCRIFAMPSTGEGFGLVFVEAARYGLPCIGGKYDSVKEIITHMENGLLAEQHPHDLAMACLKLLTDDDLAKKLGDAAQRRYLNNFRFRHFRERLLTTLGLDL